MLISEASQQPFRVLRELKNVVFRSSNEPSWVLFPLFFISPDRFKTESGEFRTERKVEFFFTRLRAAYLVFKKKSLKFDFHQNAKSECLLTVQRTKIKFWGASSNPVGCWASPNTGDFARKKSFTGGEIQEL